MDDNKENEMYDTKKVKKALLMFSDFDAKDWKSVDVTNSTRFTLDYPNTDVKIEITANIFKYKHIKLVIEIARKHFAPWLNELGKYKDVEDNIDYVYSIKVYPNYITDPNYFYTTDLYMLKAFNLDPKETVNKIFNNHAKYNIDNALEKEFNDVIDDFYKNKTSKDIKQDILNKHKEDIDAKTKQYNAYYSCRSIR